MGETVTAQVRAETVDAAKHSGAGKPAPECFMNNLGLGATAPATATTTASLASTATATITSVGVGFRVRFGRDVPGDCRGKCLKHCGHAGLLR